MPNNHHPGQPHSPRQQIRVAPATARWAASVGDSATAAIAAPWDLAARRRYYAEQNRESQLRGRAQ